MRIEVGITKIFKLFQMKKTLFIIILSLFAFVDVDAQPTGNGDGGGPSDAPINGGIVMLAVIGAVYGTKKYFKK